MTMHEGQLDLDTGLAAGLIGDQFPEWAELPVRKVLSSGTVNGLYRIGDDLVARFPLRPNDPTKVRALLEEEAAAARRMAECSPVRSPQTLGLGEPGLGYPLPWSVQSWIPGEVATSVSQAKGPRCSPVTWVA